MSASTDLALLGPESGLVASGSYHPNFRKKDWRNIGPSNGKNILQYYKTQAIFLLYSLDRSVPFRYTYAGVVGCYMLDNVVTCKPYSMDVLVVPNQQKEDKISHSLINVIVVKGRTTFFFASLLLE